VRNTIFVTIKNNFTPLYVIGHFPLVLLAKVGWRKCIMFRTEESKVRENGLLLCIAETRI
jgi:hypothetical protein